MLRNVTIPAITNNNMIRKGLLTYLPITFFDEVRYTWAATVKGS